MKKFIAILSFVLGSGIVMLFQSCAQGPFSMGWTTAGSGQAALNAQTSININNTYETQAVAVLQNNCVSCHGAAPGTSGIYSITDPNHLVQSGLVTPGQPGQSTVVSVITSHMMPPGGTVAAADLQTLENWITAMVSTGTPSPTPTPTPTPTPNPTATPPVPGANPSYAYLATNLFQVSCTSCHTGQNSPQGYDLSTYATIIASGGIATGNPSASAIYLAITSGLMPPGGTVSAALQQDLATWITNGAPNN